MSLRPSDLIALSIASMVGYFSYSLLTESLNTNLPRTMASVAPIEAPSQTATDPISVAFKVD